MLNERLTSTRPNVECVYNAKWAYKKKERIKVNENIMKDEEHND